MGKTILNLDGLKDKAEKNLKLGSPLLRSAKNYITNISFPDDCDFSVELKAVIDGLDDAKTYIDDSIDNVSTLIDDMTDLERKNKRILDSIERTKKRFRDLRESRDKNNDFDEVDDSVEAVEERLEENDTQYYEGTEEDVDSRVPTPEAGDYEETETVLPEENVDSTPPTPSAGDLEETEVDLPNEDVVEETVLPPTEDLEETNIEKEIEEIIDTPVETNADTASLDDIWGARDKEVLERGEAVHGKIDEPPVNEETQAAESQGFLARIIAWLEELWNEFFDKKDAMSVPISQLQKNRHEYDADTIMEDVQPIIDQKTKELTEILEINDLDALNAKLKELGYDKEITSLEEAEANKEEIIALLGQKPLLFLNMELKALGYPTEITSLEQLVEVQKSLTDQINKELANQGSSLSGIFWGSYGGVNPNDIETLQNMYLDSSSNMELLQSQLNAINDVYIPYETTLKQLEYEYVYYGYEAKIYQENKTAFEKDLIEDQTLMDDLAMYVKREYNLYCMRTKGYLGQEPLGYEEWYTQNKDAITQNFYDAKYTYWKGKKYYSTEHLTDEQALAYMSKYEISNYNYIYVTKGNLAANEYLDFMREELNKREGIKNAEEFLSKLDGSASDEVHTTIEGLGTGLEKYGKDITAWLYGDAILDPDDYETMYILQELTTNDKYKDHLADLYNVSTAAGYMAVPVITSVAVSVVSKSAGVTVAGTSFKNLSAAGKGLKAIQMLSSLSYSAAIGGGAYESALESGHDTNTAALYGVTTMGSQFLLNNIMGGIPGVSMIEKNPILAPLLEGNEEVAEDFVDGYLRQKILGEQVNYSEIVANSPESFKYGVLLAGITNSGKVAVDGITYTAMDFKFITETQSGGAYAKALFNSEITGKSFEEALKSQNPAVYQEYLAFKENQKVKTDIPIEQDTKIEQPSPDIKIEPEETPQVVPEVPESYKPAQKEETPEFFSVEVNDVKQEYEDIYSNSNPEEANNNDSEFNYHDAFENIKNEAFEKLDELADKIDLYDGAPISSDNKNSNGPEFFSVEVNDVKPDNTPNGDPNSAVPKFDRAAELITELIDVTGDKIKEDISQRVDDLIGKDVTKKDVAETVFDNIADTIFDAGEELKTQIKEDGVYDSIDYDEFANNYKPTEAQPTPLGQEAKDDLSNFFDEVGAVKNVKEDLADFFDEIGVAEDSDNANSGGNIPQPDKFKGEEKFIANNQAGILFNILANAVNATGEDIKEKIKGSSIFEPIDYDKFAKDYKPSNEQPPLALDAQNDLYDFFDEVGTVDDDYKNENLKDFFDELGVTEESSAPASNIDTPKVDDVKKEYEDVYSYLNPDEYVDNSGLFQEDNGSESVPPKYAEDFAATKIADIINPANADNIESLFEKIKNERENNTGKPTYDYFRFYDIKPSDMVDGKPKNISGLFKGWIDTVLKKHKNVSPHSYPNNKWLGFSSKNDFDNKNWTKMYMSVDSEHIQGSVDSILDFINQHPEYTYEMKVADKIRSDDIVIRIKDESHAKEILDFINGNDYIQEGLRNQNPFLPTIDNVGIISDKGGSYNDYIANVVSGFIEKNQDLSFENFVDYLNKLGLHHEYKEYIQNFFVYEEGSDGISIFENVESVVVDGTNILENADQAIHKKETLGDNVKTDVNFSENVINNKLSVDQIYILIEKAVDENISSLWEVIIDDLKELELNEKQELITRLNNVGLLNKLSRFKIIQLCQDVDLLDILVNDNLELISDIIAKNIDNTKELNINNTKVKVNAYIIGTISALDINQINKIFNSNQVKESIEQMTPKDMASLLMAYNNHSYKWMQTNLILNKIISYDINQFNEFLSNIDYFFISSKFKDSLLESENYDKYAEFVRYLNEKFYTIENLTKFPEMLDKVDNLVIIDYGTLFGDLRDNIEETTNEFYKILSNNILTNSNINASLNLSNKLTFENLQVGKIYDLVYKIGNETLTQSYIAFSDNITLEDLLKTYSKEILGNNVSIVSFKLNQVKSNLLITQDSGYENGLHRISLEVDGKIYNKLVEVSDFSVKNYSDEFPNAKTANIVSDKLIEYELITVSESGAYKVSYKIGDLIKYFYIFTQKKNDLNILNVKEYILKNQLVDAEIIDFEKFDVTNVSSNDLLINSFQGKTEVFTDEKYGGNQGDVSNLISNYYNNTLTENILIKKAKVLEGIVKKYYPDAAQMEIINLTESYANCGCGYMAISNALATYISNSVHATDMFKENFGYDLYFIDNGKKWYNTDALALDMYLGLFAQGASIEKLINSSNGLNQIYLEHVAFKEFFAKRNLIFSPQVTKDLNYEQLLTAIMNSKSEGHFNILATQNFDMEQLSARIEMLKSQDKALENAQKIGTIVEKVGGHGMIITDIDEHQNLIVSSWSDKYKYLHDSLQKYENSWMKLFNVKFEWKEG